jgi:hypothetical protein
MPVPVGVPEGRAAAAPASGTSASRADLAGSALSIAAVAVAALAVLAGGGTDVRALLWIGGGAALLAATGAVAAAVGLLPVPRPGLAGLALLGFLAAHAAWSGITIVWSIAPDRSWDAVNRALAYLALLAVGMVVGAAVRSAPRAAAAALAGLLGVATAWSLLGKVVPALGTDVERSARLIGPLDYWNALALGVALSLPLWLWFASERRHAPLVRAAAVAALAWSAVALLLTGSRGGVLVSAVAVAAWAALARPRLEGAAALALSLPVGGAIGIWALTRPGIAEAGADAAAQTRDGALLGLLLAAGTAVVVVLALALLRWEQEAPLRAEERRRLGRGAVAAGVAAVAVGSVAFVVQAGGPGAVLDEIRDPPEEQVQNDPTRFGEVASNNRWNWWTDAWEISRRHGTRGAGAGAFELARRPIRADAQSPLDPHNLVLKALSETGVPGLLLVLGIVASAAAVAVCALRRLVGPDRAAAAALVAAAAAWLAHSLVDMTWELAAVTAPVLLALGVLSVSGRPRRAGSGRRPLAAVAAAGLAAAAILSLAFPRLAEQRVDEALAALAEGQPRTAIEYARDAQDYNPLSVEPLHVEAVAYEAVGRLDEAETLYVRAVELQPQNAVTWYELGRFEYESRSNLTRALTYLDRSWGLDPWARDTGRLLDAVREEMAGRGS